jgi:hypothetical protein
LIALAVPALNLNTSQGADKMTGTIEPRDVCIVGLARTPIGTLQGGLSTLAATKLGSCAIEGKAYTSLASL